MTGIRNKRGKQCGLVIQPRDTSLLKELWTMRVADRNQLMAAGEFHSITRINTRLLALVHAGLLRRFFLGSGGGRKALYALAPKGAQMIELPLRGPRRRQDELLVADFPVLHQLTINDVYLVLKYTAVPVPDVRFMQWIGFTEPLAENLPLIPDGYVEFSTHTGIDASFLEVDLGTESLSVWKGKAQHYLQLATSGAFARKFGQQRFRVLVLAHSPRRVETIRAAVAHITHKIFWFAALDAARGEKLFAPVWLRPVGETTQPLFENPR